MKQLFKKRLLCLALICIMTVSLLGTLSIGASAAQASGSLFTCDFGGYEDGTATSVWGNLKTLGWTAYSDNADFGTIRIDEETGKSYLNCSQAKDTLVRIGAPLGTESVYDSGKLYISFLYRRPASATTDLRIQIMNYTDGTNTPLSSALGICALNNTLALGSGNSGAEVGDFSDGGWHSVGLLCDLDKGTVTGYADGERTETELTVADLSAGVNMLVMYLPKVTGKVADITDIVIEGSAESKAVTGSAGYEEGVVTASFNDSVTGTLTTDDVSVVKCGSVEEADVTDISVFGGTVTLKVDESTLEDGREYRVEFADSVKTLFGCTLPETYIHVPKGLTKTGWTAGGAVNEDGVIDFENLTVEEDRTDMIKSVLDPENFYTYIFGQDAGTAWYAANVGDGRRESNTNLTKNDGTTTISSMASVTGNTSGYSWKTGKNGYLANNSNLRWGLAPSTDTNGTMVFEFDMLNTMNNGCGYPSISLIDSAGVIYKIYTCPAQSNAWRHYTVSFDYKTKQASVQYDTGGKTVIDTPVAETTRPLDGRTYGTAFPDFSSGLYINEIMIRGYNGSDNAELYFDNLTQYYVEEGPAVSSVRYVDVDGNKTGLDSITPNTKEIEIKFSKAVDKSVLDGIELCPDAVTGTNYDSSTFTYTLELEGLMLQNQPYILTVPEEVTGNEVTYDIMTESGVYELRNPKMTISGQEIDDISSLPGEEINISVEQINTEDRSGAITLIYCMYDDDALVDFNYQTFDLRTGGYVFEQGFEVKTGITPDEVRVQIWNGEFSDLSPALPETIY